MARGPQPRNRRRPRERRRIARSATRSTPYTGWRRPCRFSAPVPCPRDLGLERRARPVPDLAAYLATRGRSTDSGPVSSIRPPLGQADGD